jgi:hypothetical protein
MKLTKKDCDNLIDTLVEWKECVGVKEMDDSDAGLDDDRYEDLIKRLRKYTYSPEPETVICGADCDCENETFEDFAISRLSEKDIINWSKNND